MLHRLLIAGALAATLAPACADRTPTTPLDEATAAPGAEKPERLARMFAQALGSPVFRAYLKAQLEASPFPEQKIEVRTFLGAHRGRALRYLAEGSGLSEAEVSREAGAAIALEVYLPVADHRATWLGGERLLVATAIADQDAPVAFDPAGRRRVLDPRRPPEIPVIAIVPVETDFTAPPEAAGCVECGDGGGGGGGGGAVPPPPGLYMTKAHFTQDFEGWLKGAPEFEVHLLGQKGQTDSLISYQCAGERAGGPYAFNQDNLDWSGSVLLFSKQQLDQYTAAHPAQNLRVFFVEDDDTPCTIKTDPDRFRKLIASVDSAYRHLTAGKDSTLAGGNIFKYASVAQNVWEALASFFKSNDELIGNAIQDVIVNQFYPGYNWFVKAENSITNGWVNLLMY